MADYRQLCVELLSELENAIRVIYGGDGTRHISSAGPVIAKADAALADPCVLYTDRDETGSYVLVTDPEPKGPTLDDINEICERHNFGYYYDDWGPGDQDSRTVLQSMMNEAIARWGNKERSP